MRILRIKRPTMVQEFWMGLGDLTWGQWLVIVVFAIGIGLTVGHINYSTRHPAQCWHGTVIGTASEHCNEP